MNVSILTASSLGLAFFISLGPCIAQNGSAWISAKGAVEQARTMALRGERGEAQSFLVKRLEDSQLLAADKAKLKSALNQLSNQFFNDKTQAVFELGESHFYSKRYSEALSRYQEAQELEPENTLSRVAIVKTLIAQGDCQKGEQYAKQFIEDQPHDDWLWLMLLRAEVCQEIKSDHLKAWNQKATELEKAHGVEVAWLRLLFGYRRDVEGNRLGFDHHGTVVGKDDKGEEVGDPIQSTKGVSREKELKELQKFANEERDFPEPHYYLFLAATHLDLKRKNGLEYVSLCKKSDQLIRRRYMFEPQICDRVQRVEEYLASGELAQ